MLARRMAPGCTFIAGNAKEVFREESIIQHSILSAWTRQESTEASPPHRADERAGQIARESPRFGKAERALGLKEFMHRRRVLELYRGLLKRARELGDVNIHDEARRQFRLYRDESDPLKVKMRVSDAKTSLEALQGSTGESGGARNTEKVPGDSWLDIDDPEDKRGRVGQGFPWERR